MGKDTLHPQDEKIGTATDDVSTRENAQSKKAYVTPKVESEKVTPAMLGKACSSMSTGGRKATMPCTVLLS
jgi:hypothetical protein